MSLRSHLKERFLDLDLHTVWLNEEEMRATFPLYNLSGQMLGYQRYFPLGDKVRNNDPNVGRYYTFNEGTLGVWGLESWSLSFPLFLTEGLFDAARMTSRGCSAVAALSNNPKHLQGWLWTVSQVRPVVALCDQDAAGKQLAQYGTESYTFESAKDASAASEEEVDFVVNKFT